MTPIFVAEYGSEPGGQWRLSAKWLNQGGLVDIQEYRYYLLGQSVPPSLDTLLVWHRIIIREALRTLLLVCSLGPDLVSAPSAHLTCTQQPSGLNNHDNKP